MSAAAAWAVTGVCVAIVAACNIHLFTQFKRSSLRRASIVMGVTLTIDVLVAELVPWAVMWLPLFAAHLIAAHIVMMRPAGRTHVLIGVLYAVLAAVDVAFALHGNKALVWSLYMDMVNGFTIAQAGALLMGVLSDGHRNTGKRRASRRVGGPDFQGSGNMGVSR